MRPQSGDFRNRECLYSIAITVARTCCCLPVRPGYSPSRTSEESSLNTRLAAATSPSENEGAFLSGERHLATSTLPPRVSAMLDQRRTLLPGGTTKSDMPTEEESSTRQQQHLENFKKKTTTEMKTVASCKLFLMSFLGCCC